MSNKTLQWIIGFLVAMLVMAVGSVLFLAGIAYYKNYTIAETFTDVKWAGNLSRLMKLGALLNIGVFFALLHYRKEAMAKGVILAIAVLTLVAFFI
jgi:hypothetical protein